MPNGQAFHWVVALHTGTPENVGPKPGRHPMALSSEDGVGIQFSNVVPERRSGRADCKRKQKVSQGLLLLDATFSLRGLEFG